MKDLITMRELNIHNYQLTEEQATNLMTLHIAVNELREVYGRPMIVTSGLRSMEDQLRIYRSKGRGRVPLHSAHLIGAAADFEDRSGDLKQFCMENLSFLERLGLYLEDPTTTRTWCHLQCVAPKSGNRVFLP